MTNFLDEIETNTDVSLIVTCHNIQVDGIVSHYASFIFHSFKTKLQAKEIIQYLFMQERETLKLIGITRTKH